MSPSLEIKKGLIRVEQNDGQVVWYHAKKNGKSTRVRQLSALPSFAKDKDVSLAELERQSISLRLFELKEIEERTHLPARTYSVDEPAAWAFVVERLNSFEKSKKKLIVPRTPLRDLYEWLRSAPFELHEALAEGFAAKPKAIATLCKRSQMEFQNFRHNCLLTPPSGRKPLRVKSPLASGDDLIAALQDMAAKTDGVVNVTDKGGAPLSFRIVEREIDPRRTTNGVHQNGQSAKNSGTGGIDLLAMSEDHGLPIVGEIKFGSDSTAFLALIQSLTYVVELSTISQRKRLVESFRDFQQLADRDEFRLDLYVISSSAPTDGLPPVIHKLTEKLVRGLSGTEIGKIIGRIAFLEVTSSSSGTFAVHELFSVPMRQ